MSKDTGFDARDIEWNNKGYNKDVEWDKSKNQPNALQKENMCRLTELLQVKMSISLHLI